MGAFCPRFSISSQDVTGKPTDFMACVCACVHACMHACVSVSVCVCMHMCSSSCVCDRALTIIGHRHSCEASEKVHTHKTMPRAPSIPVFSRTPGHTHTQRHAHTHTHRHANAQTHTQTHTHRHANAQTRTHTRTSKPLGSAGPQYTMPEVTTSFAPLAKAMASAGSLPPCTTHARTHTHTRANTTLFSYKQDVYPQCKQLAALHYIHTGTHTHRHTHTYTHRHTHTPQAS